MVNTVPPKFKTKELSQEIKEKITLSLSECENINYRVIKCPYCDNIITKVYLDTIGHLLLKCPKCKMETPINLAYFRRSKSYRRKEFEMFKCDLSWAN